MLGVQCFPVYEIYSCIDVCICIYLYIAKCTVYMCVHDIANSLLVADNVIFEQLIPGSGLSIYHILIT